MSEKSLKGNVWGKKAVCLITGASQNIGKEMAIQWSRMVGNDSALILTSRSLFRLEQVRDEIHSISLENRLRLQFEELDLAKPDAEHYSKKLKWIEDENWDVAIIVHNAAQLGDVGKKVSQMTDVSEIRHQLDVNVTSFLALNSIFLKHARHIPLRMVVNMSAKSAVLPRSAFGMTSMVKSSRQIVLSILAEEDPDVKVLHFDPGAVDTTSLREIRDKAHDKNIREWINGFFETNQLLTESDVVTRLSQLLDENTFSSGAYIEAFSMTPSSLHY